MNFFLGFLVGVAVVLAAAFERKRRARRRRVSRYRRQRPLRLPEYAADDQASSWYQNERTP